MGLFYNNNEAGSGVAKRGRQKKPFFRFWEMFANKFCANNAFVSGHITAFMLKLIL